MIKGIVTDLIFSQLKVGTGNKKLSADNSGFIEYNLG